MFVSTRLLKVANSGSLRPLSFVSTLQNFGDMSTDDGHKVYFSGEEGKHEYGVGFLVLKDVVGAVLGCQPVSSRLISIRLRAAPFNITIIQVYAPTSGHDDSEVDHVYQQLQETIDKTRKTDILVVQGDWNAKVGKDAQADWGEVCGPYCNVETNERGLRLLEFATFNNLVNIYEQVKFHALLLSMKKFYNLGAWTLYFLRRN